LIAALAGMAALSIASQGNDYSVKLKIGDCPVVTGKVEPARNLTDWLDAWDFAYNQALEVPVPQIMAVGIISKIGSKTAKSLLKAERSLSQTESRLK